MADKQQLNNMIDSILDGNTEQAQTYFHTFVKNKMIELIKPEDSSNDATNTNKTNGE